MSTKDRIDPKDCDHSDPEIVTVFESKDWEVTCARCKCGLRGPGWSFHSEDDQGRINAKNEVIAWWYARMPRVPSHHSEDFLTPRDEFAMAALGAIINREGVNRGNDKAHDNLVDARCAYGYADAMMQARKGGAA